MFEQFIGSLLDFVQGMDPWLRTVLAGVAVMLETSIFIGLIVPGDTVVLVAATGITDTWQWAAMVILVVVGALIGESFGYWLGRVFGPRLRASWLGSRIGEAHWDRAAAYIDRRGGIAIFLSRFLLVLHSVVPAAAGMAGMTYRRFISWTAPACVIWSVAYTTVGHLAANSFRELSRELHFAGFVFVAIIIAFVGLVWLVKRGISKHEGRHMRTAEDATKPPAP